jgi:hypothetical protein
MKMNLFRGTWNMIEDETPAHSPVRLLQKLAAYRASTISTSVSSSPSPSPLNERKSSILTESGNFFARLWRPSTHHPPPSPLLLASHESSSLSFDQIPEPCAVPIDTSPLLSSAAPIVNRRMSFIRDASSKVSSPNQNPLQSPPPPPPPLQAQPTTSSTITDPSFEDTTSEQPFDTASELFSQSFETNIDSSNPGIVDDQDDDHNSRQQPLSYNERHRRFSSSSKPIRPFVQQLSSVPMRVAEQHYRDSLPSPETSIDVSMVS